MPDSSNSDPSPAQAGLPDDPYVMALVARAVKRDQAAFGALYERFVLKIYQYLYYRAGEQSLAEDLTEEVFFKAWQAIESFRWNGRPFIAWLYGLALHTDITPLRPEQLAGTLPTDAPDVAADAAAFERTTDQHALRNALSELSPDQQRVIVLRFGCGLDTAEIAAILGHDAAAVQLLQMRALQRLGQLLAQHPDLTRDD